MLDEGRFFRADMRIEDIFALNSAGPVGLASWVFLLALVLKIGSTVLGVKLKLVEGRPDRISNGLWWLSKLSALTLCSAAAALCHYGENRAYEAGFLALLAIASVLVVWLAYRRYWAVRVVQ